jgi:hypothetical protein
MRIQCPYCGLIGKVNDDFAGRKICCPKCKKTFACDDEVVAAGVVESPPEVTAPPPSAPPEQEKPREQPLESKQIDGKQTVGQQKELPVKQDMPPKVTPPKEQQDTVRPKEAGQRESDFSSIGIADFFTRAWELTNGAKATIWQATGVMLVIVFIFGFIYGIGMAISGGKLNGEFSLGMLLFKIVRSAISTIFTAGLMYIGVKRARLDDIYWKDIFSGMQNVRVVGFILLAALLQMILVSIGFLLLILPGIYLAIGYSQTLPLIIDKKMSTWEAMEISRKTIHKVWWKYFAVMFICWILTLVAIIPLGIGLIWMVPLGITLTGVLYGVLFDSE